MAYNSEGCNERHNAMVEKINRMEKRQDSHSQRLDKVEQAAVGLQTEIKNLISQLQSLSMILKWFIGLLIGSFVAFFFYAVQQNIFK